ncbi:MAG: dihydrodipicolinate reductase [Deltaproteobacteria bacterium]|nr:MAG: dihydrodipicolinate reductase [Deltaproteobacteria bacterium]
MKQIPVMINGLPGNLASTILAAAQADERFSVIQYSLTGPDTALSELTAETLTLSLIKPDDRDRVLARIRADYPDVIVIDYTHPSAVNANALAYCRHTLPFVMGTTGGDRDALVSTVNASQTAAVIAPNMAKQIVGFQAMMAYAAEQFPDLFRGYRLDITESHQSWKADTSGTAKAMVSYFNTLGIPFSAEEIRMERDPKVQALVWQIPPEHLNGHGWHTYTLGSGDGTATFRFTHNINGREIYAEGTLDAVIYLAARVREQQKGMVFSMMDVLRGA